MSGVRTRGRGLVPRAHCGGPRGGASLGMDGCVSTLAASSEACSLGVARVQEKKLRNRYHAFKLDHSATKG